MSLAPDNAMLATIRLFVGLGVVIALFVLNVLADRGCLTPKSFWQLLVGMPATDARVVLDATALERTSFAPSLQSAIEPGSNLVWCATLPLAFDALVDAARQRFDPDRMGPVARAIEGTHFDPSALDPGSYVVGAGLTGSATWHPTFRSRVRRRFGEVAAAHWGRGTGAELAAAHLEKQLPFMLELDDLSDSPGTFANAGTNAYETWGLKRYDPANTATVEAARQATVFHYAGPDDFAIEFTTKTGDRVVLAELDPGATLEETWQRVLSRRRAFEQASERDRQALEWRLGDTLAVPKLDFNLCESMRPIKPGIEGHDLVRLRQSLRLRLDHRGASAVAWANVTSFGASADQKRMTVDRAFLMALVEAQASDPCLVAWIGDAEVLIPAYSGRGGRQLMNADR